MMAFSAVMLVVSMTGYAICIASAGRHLRRHEWRDSIVSSIGAIVEALCFLFFLVQIANG